MGMLVHESAPRWPVAARAGAGNSLGAILDRAAKELERHGRDAPRLSAEILAGEALSLSRLEVLVNRDMPVPPDQGWRIESLVRRRALGEPLAYILGRKEFYGRCFEVTPHVLIPRPETELIVDLAKAAAPAQETVFADVCTGSGNLAVSLALELPGSSGVASDLCPEALSVACRNIRRMGLQERVLPLRTDVLEGIGPAAVDLVVANPPYLTREQFAASAMEVRGFEPGIALQGGETGLDILEALLKDLAVVIKPGGLFFVEIDPAQQDDLLAVLDGDASKWTQVKVVPDLRGEPRVLSARRV